MQGLFYSSFRTPCNAVKNPAPFCMIFVRVIVSRSVFFFFCATAAAATRSSGEFEGPSRHHRRRNHSMTLLPRKLSCLACMRLHCAPPFVFSVRFPPTSWPLYYQFLEGRMDGKRVSPGFAISVRSLRGHTVPLSPATCHQTHAPLLRLGSTAYSGPSETGDYTFISCFVVVLVVIWDRFHSRSLKITYHYRDA